LLLRKPLQRAESVETITADGSPFYALPADFLGVIGVFRDAGEVKYPLKRFPDKFRPGNRQRIAHYYRLQGNTLVLFPKPTTVTYALVYIPLPGTLSTDSDELDGVLGWEEFVVIEASINVLTKEESNT